MSEFKKAAAYLHEATPFTSEDKDNIVMINEGTLVDIYDSFEENDEKVMLVETWIDGERYCSELPTTRLTLKVDGLTDKANVANWEITD